MIKISMFAAGASKNIAATMKKYGRAFLGKLNEKKKKLAITRNVMAFSSLSPGHIRLNHSHTRAKLDDSTECSVPSRIRIKHTINTQVRVMSCSALFTAICVCLFTPFLYRSLPRNKITETLRHEQGIALGSLFG